MSAYHHYKPKASTNYHDLLFLIRNSLPKEVDGNPYLMDWEDALLFVDEDKIYSVRARYRVLDDEFQLDMNGTIKAVYPHLIKGIVFKDRVFVSGTELRQDGQLHGFYEKLVNGHTSLLKKYTVNQKMNKEGVIEVGATHVTYHFRRGEEFVESIDEYRKRPCSIFVEHLQFAKSYWKSNKLSINEEADLHQFFSYCNELP
jgi:hypothetical protein